MAKKTTSSKKTPAAGISKMDGVRQAIKELGQQASRTEIQKFLKDRLGIEMNLDVVSTYKAIIAKKAATKPATTTPDVKPVVAQQTAKAAAKKEPSKPVVTAPPPVPAAVKPVSAESEPTTTQRRKRGRPRKAAPQAAATITTVPTVKATEIALADIQAVIELVKRVGVSTLKGLIDVFGK